MQITSLAIPDVLLIKPKVFGDTRGFFFESFNQKAFNEAIGTSHQFVQDNHSRSSRGVLRGLHYQIQQPQWAGAELSVDNHHQLWVPPGFAHGFLTLSESAEFLYKTTDYYAPQHERCIVWNDPDLDIAWPDVGVAPQLSAKDRSGPQFQQAELPA
jgi:dTDP-4-dehydrorhamnose 3,5-epimerase